MNNNNNNLMSQMNSYEETNTNNNGFLQQQQQQNTNEQQQQQMMMMAAAAAAAVAKNAQAANNGVSQTNTAAPQKRTRTKHNERTVKEVIELVEKWRALHCGSFNRETNQIVRYSLAEAAKILKVPRKSLDDYLLMMKHAKAFGFDFEANLNEKFGAVRTFVKNYRSSALEKKMIAGGVNASNGHSDEDLLDDDDNNTDASSSPKPVSKKSKKISKWFFSREPNPTQNNLLSSLKSPPSYQIFYLLSHTTFLQIYP